MKSFHGDEVRLPVLGRLVGAGAGSVGGELRAQGAARAVGDANTGDKGPWGQTGVCLGGGGLICHDGA